MAPDSLYGMDNLPYGVFSTGGDEARVGVRLGDVVVDVAAVLGEPRFVTRSLNAFMAEGPDAWGRVREALHTVLRGDVAAEAQHAVSDVTMHLPIEVADYVDFYASENHARNLGRMFRPDSEPLLPNWKHLPVGYHGRAGSVVVSGEQIVRPEGQHIAPDQEGPVFGPSRKLDIEVELGFVVGVGCDRGATIGADDFERHVFGAVLLNDWSARDIQAWEYVPLGPNLGKSFATSIGAWVVPLAALQGARVSVPRQEPDPLPHLRGGERWGLDVEFSVEWNGEIVSRPPYRDMYWSPAQMLAHQSSNGSGARTGDLFASGTVSGADSRQVGSFIELTRNGSHPVVVAGQERSFLLDGDTVTISASAPGVAGAQIGFGEVTGTIRSAVRR